MVHWVVSTIDKEIICRYTLICAQHPIRINKAAGGGVVVAALEIVQPAFLVVVVPAVAERIRLAHRRRLAAGDGEDVPPTIIGIFYHHVQRVVK